MTFHPDSLPDLTGKVYIVTGGTSGIGYYTVARLAQHGAHVYLCARSQTKGAKATKGIKALYPNAHISILEMDHLSLSSVVSAAKEFLSKETALHGLVNNAGIMATPFEISKDGYEAQFQTNYIAHWVFTYHLLPLLLATAKGLPPGSVRIVGVTSSGHLVAPKGGINFDDISLKNSAPMDRYGQSKLANILHIKTLNKLYGPDSAKAKAGGGEIWTAAVHPGVVESQLGEHVESLSMWLRLVASLVRVGGDEGSWSSVFCAASPGMKRQQSGMYYCQRSVLVEPSYQSSAAKDLDLAARLEEWTSKEMKKGGWIE
ncbi:putative Carbonyl reductase [Pleurostoma richardsiae]|uniref:Carbonyl reductase n=1 Tax=Pleurostoma richardsiae TaxID=41990 RepID=A0AA38R9A9_9PEZI|nr:putative Carbonyl reductase [Pleurostoma richardsiae]